MLVLWSHLHAEAYMDDKTNSNVTSKLSDKDKISTENCVILIKYEAGKNIKTWVINEFVFVCG